MNRTVKLFEGESILLECQPQKKFTSYNTLRNIFAYLVFLVIFIVASISKFNNLSVGNQAEIYLKSIPIVVSLIVLIFFILIYFKNSIVTSKMKYVFTDQRCILFSGFIGTNQNTIPYNRIADVNIAQDSFQALWGLSSVMLDEQVGFGRKTLIEGLSMNDAESIMHVISQHITKKMA